MTSENTKRDSAEAEGAQVEKGQAETGQATSAKAESAKSSTTEAAGAKTAGTESERAKRDPAEILATLREDMRSVLLSTLGEDGLPHSGYTPFVFDGADLIIFVSQLSLHTRDLLHNGQVSAMLIADEQQSQQIFARTRVSYQCKAIVVAKDDDSYDALLDQLHEGHGKMIGLLRQLPDFVLFRLQPIKGQFVMGFGQAYHLTGEKLDRFEHATSA